MSSSIDFSGCLSHLWQYCGRGFIRVGVAKPFTCILHVIIYFSTPLVEVLDLLLCVATVQ